MHTCFHPFKFSEPRSKSWLRGSLAVSCLFFTLAGTAAETSNAAGRADAAATERPARIEQMTAAAPVRVHPAETERLAAHIAQKWKVPPPTAQRVVKAAYEQAPKQRISPTLVLAIVAQESGFRPTVQSSRGAQGLMQVRASDHPDKLKGKEHRALLEPETNIEVGTQVLAEYLNENGGRLDAALKAYSGNASAFSRKVRAAWQEFEQVRAT